MCAPACKPQTTYAMPRRNRVFVEENGARARTRRDRAQGARRSIATTLYGFAGDIDMVVDARAATAQLSRTELCPCGARGE